MSSTVSGKKSYGLFMTLLMVIYHLLGILGNMSSADSAVLSAFKWHFQVVGTPGTAHFFIISGFLLYYHTDDVNILNKLKRRIKSLLVPLAFYVLDFISDTSLFCNGFANSLGQQILFFIEVSFFHLLSFEFLYLDLTGSSLFLRRQFSTA